MEEGGPASAHPGVLGSANTTSPTASGAGTAKKRLTSYGHEYYKQAWPEGKAANSRNSLYNALWRTSTYEYVMLKVFDQ